MLLYFLIYLFLALLALFLKPNQSTKLVFWIMLIVLIFFVGFRLNTGCDFLGYWLRFKYFDISIGLQDRLLEAEAGFAILTHWVKSFELDYQWLNFFSALILFSTVAKFLSVHPRYFNVLCIMFPILIVQLSMSGIRQSSAVAFLMLACHSFILQRRMLVILFIFLAASFHQTAIIFLPMAFLIGRSISAWKLFVAVTALAPLSIFLISDRLDVYQDRYIEQIYGPQESSGAVIRFALMLITASLFQWYKKPMLEVFPRYFSLLQLFSLITIALIPMMFISSVAVHRLGYYILPVQLFTAVLLPYAIFKDNQARNMFQFVIILSYAIYLLVWFSFSKHANYCYIPYDSYLLQ